jgi:hypothetical protein
VEKNQTKREIESQRISHVPMEKKIAENVTKV